MIRFFFTPRFNRFDLVGIIAAVPVGQVFGFWSGVTVILATGLTSTFFEQRLGVRA